MAEIVIAVAGKVSEYLVAPIGRQLGYLFCCRSHTDDLRNKVQTLGEARDDLQKTVDEARRRGDEIRPVVQDWLNRVDQITVEVEELIMMKDEENEKKKKKKKTMMMISSCFKFNGNVNGRWCSPSCPIPNLNLKSRYQLGRKAYKKAQVIVEIQTAHNFPDGVSHRVPPRSVTFKEYESYQSRASTLNILMDALRDDKTKITGVWGMGGVGKTTLLKQVAEQAKQEKLFTTQIYIDVSWTRSEDAKIQQGILDIQQHIADMLGLKLEEKTMPARAGKLMQRLKKGKILILLDDIWKEVNLEEVGIPSSNCNDDDDQINGCKIVLASRDEDILSQMNAQRRCPLQHLKEEEARRLFKKTVGDSVENNLELQLLSTKIVKECEGLPVAIVTIAKALKGKSMGVWRNALTELQRSEPTNITGVSKNVYSCLKLSYSHLESHEAKSLFLLCGFLGEGNISMEDLLKCVMDDDLFNYTDSLEDARDKLVSLVETLKAKSLLLDVLEDHADKYREPPSLYFVEEEGNRHVKMHDIIRDVAKSIASKDPHHRFVVKEDVSLQEWRKRDVEWRNCIGMSLKCTRLNELPKRLVCPQLRFFLLDNSGRSLKIPGTFFEEMKEMRVLSLSSVNLTQLPSSFHFLSNLRTLCLYRCGMLNDIAMVGNLKKLQILSIVSSEIGEFPEAMKQLSDLRMLSLRPCPKFIPRNVISGLSRLEYLSVRNEFSIGGDEEEVEGRGTINMNNIAWLSELKDLSCLRALEVEIPYSYLLSEDVSFDNLTRYDIFIGYKRRSWNDRTNTSTRLKLNKVTGSDLAKCFSTLLKTTKVVDIRRMNGTRHFVNDELDCDVSDPSSGAFPLLEELNLSRLNDLEAICYGPIPMVGCFAKLRTLRIDNCHNLKCILLWLIPTSTAQGRESVLVFPQLHHLTLSHLPNLLHFYSTATGGNQQQLIVPSSNQRSLKGPREICQRQFSRESFSKLRKLGIYNCDKIWIMIPSSMLQVLNNLERLTLRSCNSVEEVIQVEGVVQGGETGVLPQLSEMYLEDLPMLRHVFGLGCGLRPVILQNLHSLKVSSCGNLINIVSHSMAKRLVQLKKLSVTCCSMVEEIVGGEEARRDDICFSTELEIKPLPDDEHLANNQKSVSSALSNTTFPFPSLEEMEVKGLPRLTHIYKKVHGLVQNLQKLRILKVYGCGNLEILLTLSLAKSLVQLEKLTVEECGKVKEIVGNEGGGDQAATDDIDDEIIFNKLQILHLRRLPNLETFSTTGNTFAFPSKEEMEIKELPRLTHLYKKLPPGCAQNLQNLRVLRVSSCRNLEILLTLSMAKTLVQLEELTMNDCDKVKEIFENDQGEGAGGDEVIFTKLRILHLRCLANLKSLSSASNNAFLAFPSLEEMEVKELPKLTHLFKKIPPAGRGHHNLQNLRVLRVSHCGNLEFLFTLSLAKTLVQLKSLTVEYCHEMKEIFETDQGGGGDDQSTDDEIIFTKLRILHLHHLPNLKSLSSATNTFLAFPSLEEMEVKKLPRLTQLFKRTPPVGCGRHNLQNLRVLQVSHCGNLEFLLTLSLAKTLVQLESLIVEDCDDMKEIVLENEGGGDQAMHDDEIIFTKLQTLTFCRLRNLKNFCSAKYTFKFPCFTEMWMIECPEMEFFCKRDSIAQTLDGGIAVKDFNSSWENGINATIRKMFMKTHMLQAGETNVEERLAVADHIAYRTSSSNSTSCWPTFNSLLFFFVLILLCLQLCWLLSREY